MRQKRYTPFLIQALAAAVWILPAGCDNQDTELLVSPSSHIEFNASTISVESRLAETDGQMRNVFKPHDSFGVFGYCVPLHLGDNSFDYSAGSSFWISKMQNAVPDVFLNQRVTLTEGGSWQYDFSQKDEEPTTYQPKYWYALNRDTEGKEQQGIPDAKNYRYDFFAYYPYDNTNTIFQWIKPASGTDRGAPQVKISVPQDGTSIANSKLDLTKTPDAMLGVIHNFLPEVNARVSFSFNHIFTALGFEVNNFSESDLKVHSVTLSGTFYKSVSVDFTNGSYTYNADDTYTGTYVLFDESRDGELLLRATNQETTVTSSPSPIGGNYVRLLSGGFSGNNYLGPIIPTVNETDQLANIRVNITYTFGNNGRTTQSFTRPGTFLPQAGTQYTSQLNFVGNAFVLQFVVDNGESWENGESDDAGDIIFG